LEAINKGHTSVEVESALSVAISRWQELQRGGGARPRLESTAAAMELCFAGSHDLAVDLLARMLAEEAPDVRLSVEYIGSLGGLMALANDEANVAGSHLWDETTDAYNAPFVRRVLPGQRVALLTLAYRSLGLIVPPGNLQEIKGLADLTKPDVVLINRQSGSGTRVWLDAQLKFLGIQPESVQGYEQESLTHLAVAHAVEERRATAGLGIHAAAAACGLDFIPLTKERYDLVIPETVWILPATRSLVQVVRSDRFQGAISALGGYDTTETGQETWVS
jgi:putative molybdopterin biosynthesis protein